MVIAPYFNAAKIMVFSIVWLYYNIFLYFCTVNYDFIDINYKKSKSNCINIQYIIYNGKRIKTSDKTFGELQPVVQRHRCQG